MSLVEFQDFVSKQDTFNKPVLRMFLSVDLVNSTVFKQKIQSGSDHHGGNGQFHTPWLNAISSFYREFPIALMTEWATVIESVKDNPAYKDLVPPRLWKANGDELIYVVDLKNTAHPRLLLAAWLKALWSHRTKLHVTKNGLDLKSACWVAGFPISNTEILFKESVDAGEEIEPNAIVQQIKLKRQYYLAATDASKAGILRDYVGPSIDTGFRLGSLASPRKLILSLELAWLLAGSNFPHHAAENVSSDYLRLTNLKFYYDGRVPLKGVLGGIPYPVFWIDADLEKFSALNKSEDELSGLQDSRLDKITEYCALFVRDRPTILGRPFILGDQFFGEPMSTDYYSSYESFIEKLNSQSMGEIASEQRVTPAVTSKSTEEATPISVGEFKKTLKFTFDPNEHER